MRRRVPTLMTIAVLWLSATTAQAQQPPPADTGDGPPEARFEGYAGGTPVKMDVGTGAFANWAIFVVMAAIGFGVMFKNSNRTHLD